MRRYGWLFVLLMLLLAACKDKADQNGDGAAANDQNLNGVQWSKDANQIVLRLDARRNEAAPVDLANSIPPCTLWGDGHLVWLNPLENETQVLEARLDDAAIRGLIEYMVGLGFYSWQSNFLIPNNYNPEIQTITLNVFDNSRTVSRYSDWDADGYNAIITRCRELAASPVLYLPEGGWLTAYETVRQENVPYWEWSPETAGFSLAEIADQEPRWITGDVAKAVWQNTIMQPARVTEGDKTYQLAIQVPNISRDAPPAPQE